MRRTALIAILAVLTGLCTTSTRAQFIGPRVHDDFKDTSILRPPAGSNVAIIVFEDLRCPHCAVAHPIELQAAREYHVPILRYDFPLAYHVWTFQGAVCARYLQDKVSPTLADQFRTDVFASQRLISNKDDLQQFTRHWLQRHGQQMPFVIDPNGSLTAKVQADYDLGLRLHVTETPTVVVVTRNNYQIVCGKEFARDPTQLFPVLRAAIAQTAAAPAKPATKPHAKPQPARATSSGRT